MNTKGIGKNLFSSEPIIKVRVLILIYTLLFILTVLLSRNFFNEILIRGEMPGNLNLIVFFTIPAVLLIVFGISIFHILTDMIFKRPGSKFNARLLGYFAVTVIFSITPVILMTGSALNEIVRFWQSINAQAVTRSANSFIADNYSMHMERFENLIKQNDFSDIEYLSQGRFPADVASVQVFRYSQEESWSEILYTGNEEFRLSSSAFLQITPAQQAWESGFTAREMPRDRGTIRYVQRFQHDGENAVSVINYNLGADFDTGRAALENQAERFEIVNELRENLRPLLIYYYFVFFLPTLLMTVIITISFTRRITHPIIDLTKAIQRVSEGDFSIQILTRRDDELGILIKSFNSMVQDLEKSRAALVNNEKISIWQNMAQQLAHEIKNPLTPIRLSAERVLRRWQKNPENIGEILESSMMAIIQETDGLSTLLNEFRTLSKPMEPSNSAANLYESINDVINSYSSSYSKILFDTENIQTDIQIKISKHRFSQILTNIIINAIDAMDGNGLIEIRSDLVKKREVCYCRISVKDTGKGISKEESRLIFTPYYTTKESGTGLGLPIIERIVNDHYGSIWFDSAEGAGTTFYIDLPAALPAANGE